MEKQEYSVLRHDALCFFVTSLYREMLALTKTSENAISHPVPGLLIRSITLCFIDASGIATGCVRISADWGSFRHYCRQCLPLPAEYRSAYEAESPEILRLVRESFSGCHIKPYFTYEETADIDPPGYEILSMNDWYNSLNRKLTYTCSALPELRLVVARE